MQPEIKIKGADIPRLIDELKLVQRSIEKNQEIMVQLEGHLGFEQLLEIMMDSAIQLSSYRDIEFDVNPSLSEKMFIEQDESTGNYITTPGNQDLTFNFNINGKTEVHKIPAKHINKLSKEKFAVFFHDKNPDGTIALERNTIVIPRVRINHQLKTWFMNVATTASQLRTSIGTFVSEKSQIAPQMPKGLIPVKRFTRTKREKPKRQKDQSNKAYHVRKASRKKHKSA